jgi:AraC-like DNA-binding protein
MTNGSDSTYERREPRALLRGVVRCVWRHRSSSTARRTERIPPDGCAELIFNLGAGYAELTANGETRPQPPALFAGQITRPLTLIAGGPVDTIGVRFEPDGAREFFLAPMNSATNLRIALQDIKDVDATRLVEGLRELDDERQQARLEDFVEGAIAGGPGCDAAISSAIRQLTNNEAVAVEGLSMRQLQRRFLHRVGASMREYQSILRFRRVFDAIETEPDWARSALAAGYFDQAQMARDFRRYLGCTASEWARQKTGLSAAIAHEASQSYKPGRR